MTTVIQTLLVSSHFNPPAKQMLEHLPSGAKLVLQPDPQNPYDEKAIRVLVSRSEVPETQVAELRDKLPSMGHDWDEMEQLVMLGHLPDSEGKICLKEGIQGNGHVHAAVLAASVEWSAVGASLAFDPAGRARVIVKVGG